MPDQIKIIKIMQLLFIEYRKYSEDEIDIYHIQVNFHRNKSVSSKKAF